MIRANGRLAVDADDDIALEEHTNQRAVLFDPVHPWRHTRQALRGKAKLVLDMLLVCADGIDALVEALVRRGGGHAAFHTGYRDDNCAYLQNSAADRCTASETAHRCTEKSGKVSSG